MWPGIETRNEDDAEREAVWQSISKQSTDLISEALRCLKDRGAVGAPAYEKLCKKEKALLKRIIQHIEEK